MSPHTKRYDGAKSVSRRALALTAALVLPLLGACDVLDGLVDVEAPSRIQAEVIEQPENALTLLAGVQGDFECAFSMYSAFSADFSDELEAASGSEAWGAIDARRTPTSGFDAAYAYGTCSAPHQGTLPGVYKPLHTARFQGEHLIQLVDEWGDRVQNPDLIRERAAAYAGYATLLLGEAMCSTPFDLGPDVDTQGIFERALADFSTTLQIGADADLTGLAHVGSARALARMGRLSEAEQHASQVPAGFVFNAGMASAPSRRINWVFYSNSQANFLTVSPSFRDSDDPRIPVIDAGREVSGVHIYVQNKYAGLGSPIPVATWAEAQLIIAEAELAAGDNASAVVAINAVRTRPGVDLPPFTSDDAAEIRAQLMYERRAELFLDSHRMGDIRFYDLPLEPEPGSAYRLGGTYEDARCLPIPLDEEVNNPNLNSTS